MEKDIYMEEKYETSDLALASYLYSSGTPLLGLDRKNSSRCIFVFEEPKPELLSKWQEAKAMVNAMAFYNAFQFLKAKVFRGEE